MNNKYLFPIVLAIGSIAVALWYIFDTNKINSDSTADTTNLNKDWQKLHGDFTNANNKFKQQYGA